MAELLPCPFCGGEEISIKPNGGTWKGGTVEQKPISYDVQHWCSQIYGQPRSRLISRCGKTLADAIAAWNQRAPVSAGLKSEGQQTTTEELKKFLDAARPAPDGNFTHGNVTPKGGAPS